MRGKRTKATSMIDHSFFRKRRETDGGIRNLLNIVSDAKVFPDVLKVAESECHYNEIN